MMPSKKSGFARLLSGWGLFVLALSLQSCGDIEQKREHTLNIVDAASTLRPGSGLPPADVLATIEARRMPTRVGCGDEAWAPPGMYAQNCNGYVEQELAFPSNGVLQFNVSALGSLANGVGPDMELRIDQRVVGKVNVAATSLQTYSFHVPVTAGSHKVALAFTNDLNADSDRNLYLEKLVIRAQAEAFIEMQSAAMETKYGCGGLQADQFYAQLCNGYVEHEFYFPAAGSYHLSVSAYGSHAGGAWPYMELFADGAPLGGVKVSKASADTYVLTADVPAGSHKLRVAFQNDYYGGSPGSDRNLYLGKLAVYKAGLVSTPSWQLIWADEFNGSSIDLQRWNYEVNGDGGGNNELQYYTDHPDNSFIEEGALVIQALRQNYHGRQYTSARMTTRKKFDFTYGRVEVRARLPFGQGIWPAIWMIPTDSIYGGWPMSGEIDIMELLGQEPSRIYGTLHYGDAWPQNKHTGQSFKLAQGDFSQDFHVFSIEWEPQQIKWFVDGQHFSTRRPQDLEPCKDGQRCPWRFDQDFFFILNVAVGGNWPGGPDASTSFPQTMKVDYVRVYQKASSKGLGRREPSVRGSGHSAG